jgi:hypothetical protein
MQEVEHFILAYADGFWVHGFDWLRLRFMLMLVL